MSEKSRWIAYYPDELFTGVAAQLTPFDLGVYWMICTLIYSRGGPIDDDAEWIAGTFRKTRPGLVRASIERLVDNGKITRRERKLTKKRCEEEISRASKRSRVASENGAKGGRPPNETNDLGKATGSAPAKPNEKLTRTTTTTDSPKPPHDDAPGRPSQGEADRFAEWYAVYPRKVGRGQAERAYRAAIKQADHDTLVDGARRYAQTVAGKDAQYVAHPATWLNGKRWLDDDSATQQQPVKRANGVTTSFKDEPVGAANDPAQRTHAQRQACQLFGKGQPWPDILRVMEGREFYFKAYSPEGAAIGEHPPGHPDCRIPADVVAEVLGSEVARSQRNYAAGEQVSGKTAGVVNGGNR